VSINSRETAGVDRHVDDGAEAFGETGLHPGVGKDEVEHLAEAGADELEVALEGEVVAEKELAEPRRVAGAAGILEQEHVVKVGEFGVSQADGPADAAADPAAADAVARRLALGHVEGVAEGADELGEADG
jgi:hypothetical protein